MRVVVPALVGPGSPSPGGTQANVTALVSGLRARGHAVQVLGHGPPEAESPDFLPVFDRREPRGRDLSLALWRRRGTWRWAGDTVVNVHRPDHALGFLSGPWPLVVNFRGVHRREIARSRGPLASWVYGAATRRVMTRADALVFTTGFDRDEVTGGRVDWIAKTHIVPTGVDRERFAPRDREAARRRLGLPGGVFGVGFAGRLAPEKNLGALVDAVESLPGAELWLAGSGPLADKLRRRAGNRVRFLGFLDDDLSAFYAASDVVALASLYEGRPTVIAEAWASGRPVVVPDVTGMRELLVAGGGILAANPGAEAVAAALAECRRALDAGRPDLDPARLRERSEPFGWERIVEATLDVFTRARERRCGS